MSEIIEQKDPFTAYEEIECRDGVKRRVYPAKLKYKDLIRKLSPKFNDVFILENVFELNNTTENYTDEAWNSMLELLYLAFDEKYSKEEILDFLDFNNVSDVFEVFYGLSGLKKKKAQMTMA